MGMSSAAPRCSCDVQTLARSGSVHVQHCTPCRCVSLSLGAVTVRLEEAALGVVVETLAAALHALDERAQPHAVVQPRGFA